MESPLKGVIASVERVKRQAETAYTLIDDAIEDGVGSAIVSQELMAMREVVLDVLEALTNLSIRLGTKSAARILDHHTFSLSVLDHCLRVLAEIGLALQGSTNSRRVAPNSDELTRLRKVLSEIRFRLRQAVKVPGPLTPTLFLLSISANPDHEESAACVPMRIPPDEFPEKRLLGALRQRDFSTERFQKLFRSRLPGTLEWLFFAEHITAWLDGRVSRLWVIGAPGCGKSVEAATITDRLIKTYASSNTSVCYVFLDSFKVFTTLLGTVMSSLLAQLAVQSQEAFNIALQELGIWSPAFDLWHSPAPGETPLLPGLQPDLTGADRSVNFTDLHTLVSISNRTMTAFKMNFLVVDGIDETPDSKSLIELLCKLDGPNLRLLMVSRKVVDLDAIPTLAPGVAVHETAASPGDIELLVKTAATQHKTSRVKAEIDTGVFKQMSSSLAKSRNFRYAECNLHQLIALGSDEARRLYLLNMPRSLDATYEGIIQRAIDAEMVMDSSAGATGRTCPLSAREQLWTLLLWIWQLSFMALRLPEIRLSRGALFEALAVAASPEANCLEEVEPARQYAMRFTKHLGLFAWDGAKNDDSSALSHRTLAEYLSKLYHVHERGSAQLNGQYSMNGVSGSTCDINNTARLRAQSSQSSLGVVSMRFLHFRDFRGLPDEARLEQAKAVKRLDEHPLYSFAAAWALELSRNCSWNEVATLAVRLFTLPETKGNFITFFLGFTDVHFSWKYSLRTLPDTPMGLVHLIDHLQNGTLSPFHVACALGLPDVCRAMKPSSNLLVNEPSPYGLPLTLAIVGPQAFGLIAGRESVTDFYSPQNPRRTGIHSLRPRETILLLVEMGADIKAKVPRVDDEELISLASNVLMACAALSDADLFIQLVLLGLPLDVAFCANLAEIRLPALGIDPHTQINNTVARWNRRILTPEQENFLDAVCQFVIDFEIVSLATGHLPAPVRASDLSDTCLLAAWHCALEYDLPCSRTNTKRQIDCSDADFARLWESARRDFNYFVIRRLSQDSRWEVNHQLEPQPRQSSGTDAYAGQTALHLAVEESHIAAIELLLDNGADLSIRDAKGRQAVHLVEKPDVLQLLMDRGVDLTVQDDDGHTLWHILAANNDSTLLPEMLKLGDRAVRIVLRTPTKQGRTPLAEALAYGHIYGRWATALLPDEVAPRAAEFLAPLCQHDPACFQSDIPLAHYAAAWASEPLLGLLEDSGAIDRKAVTKAGETPFHFLRHYARPSFVAALIRILGPEAVSKVTHAGLTAAETFLKSLEFGFVASAPFMSHVVDPAAYEMLLTPDVIESKNQHGQPLWERFCINAVGFFIDKPLSPGTNARAAGESLRVAAEALTKKGAIQAFERSREMTMSGIVPLVLIIVRRSKSFVLDWSLKMCGAVVKATECFEENKNDFGVILTLQYALILKHVDLAQDLLSRGTSIHHRGRGVSLLEDLHRVDLEMFKLALRFVEKDKIDELNPSGRALIHSLAGDIHTVTQREDKLKALLDAGASVDARTGDGMPAMVLAAIQSQQACAIILFDRGADRKAKLPDGLDVLLAAASRGCLQILRKLGLMETAQAYDTGKKKENVPPSLDMGWVLESRCSIVLTLAEESMKKTVYHGCHALHLAAMNGHVGTIRFILDSAMIPIDEPCFDANLTALHFAAIGGATDAIRLLVEKGADVDAHRPGIPSTPLHLAIKANQPESVRTLIQLGCKLEGPDPTVVPPLILAVKLSSRICIDLLLEASVNGQLPGDVAKATGGSAPHNRIAPAQPTEGSRNSTSQATSSRPNPPTTTSAVGRQTSTGGSGKRSNGNGNGSGRGNSGPGPDPPLLPWPPRTPGKQARYIRLLAQALEAAITDIDGPAAVSVVRAVLARGCPVDVTLPSCNGCTALVCAVRARKPAVVSLLLNAGATRFTSNCAKHSVKGINVVYEGALRPDRAACLELVLDAALRLGINWFNAPITPIHLATQNRNLPGVVTILKHLTTHAQKYNKWVATPLPNDPTPTPVPAPASTTAVAAEIPPVVRYMVNRPLLVADVEDYYPDNSSALHLAVVADFNELVDVLLLHGADINALDTALSTPLHCAVTIGSVSAVQFLLDRGAAPDLRDQDGYSPLMRAARNGSIELCRIFVARGADARARDADGMSLLSVCAEQNGSPTLFAYLVDEVGLDPYARDKTTYCPLHDALLNSKMRGYVLGGQFDFYRVAKGQDLMKGLLALVVEDGSAELILPKLYRRWPKEEWGRYVNYAPKRYNSPLCVAAMRGFVMEAKFLLERDADPEVEGCAEGTALMSAAAHGRLKVVEVLVRVGGARIAYTTTVKAAAAAAASGAAAASEENGAGGGSEGGGEAQGSGSGEVIVRNALEYAKPFPEIVRWLLVERYTSQGKIAATSAASAAGEEEEREIKPWGGPMTIRYMCTGTTKDYGLAHRESMLAYLQRITRVKYKLRGTVVAPYEGP